MVLIDDRIYFCLSVLCRYRNRQINSGSKQKFMLVLETNTNSFVLILDLYYMEDKLSRLLHGIEFLNKGKG